MSKKHKCPECPPPGAPAYMTTYGDMMTLLLTFFVLLLTFSSIQDIKFQKAISSLKGALGVLRADRGTYVHRPNVPLFEFRSGDMEFQINRVLEQLEEVLRQTGTHDKIKFDQSRDRIHFNISSPTLFDSGSADLKEDAFPILDEIAKVLRMVNFEIRVEGHTDNVPISTVRFPSNWELSAARALSVVRYFVELDVPPERFQAIGYGEYRPIATNETPEGRSINRRVEIYVNLKSDVRGSLLPSQVFGTSF